MPGNRFDYSGERQRHEKFVGRAGLLTRLDQLLVDSETDRWVVITGGPGMGKSALLAAWLARRVAAVRWCITSFAAVRTTGTIPQRWSARWWRSSRTAFPIYASPTGTSKCIRRRGWPGRCRENKLQPRGERLVVLIDGLDEYDPPAGRPIGDPLAGFLPDALPAG